MTTYQKANIIGGGFQAPDGTPLSNGYLLFRLSHDSNVDTLNAPTGAQVAAGLQVVLFLDQNGNLVSNQYLWTNDVLTPSGSYYLVNAYTSQGVPAWKFPQTFFIQPYETSINIGSLIPQIP